MCSCKFIKIRHPLLVWYIRILRSCGLRPIWYSGSNPSIRSIIRNIRYSRCIVSHLPCIRRGGTDIRLAVITLILPHYFNAIASSGYGNRHIRRFCSDYGMPITIIALTGFAYWGRFNPYVLLLHSFLAKMHWVANIRFVNEENMTLPTNSVSFQAENARSWLVRFWELPGKWVGIAFPFGFVLWILFYFDHNVSVCSPSSKKLKEG